MEAYKFEDTIFIKPNTMLFNAVKTGELIDISNLDPTERLQKVKEIFNSLECVWIDRMYWEFNDAEKKIILKGVMTIAEEKEFEIINVAYLKELARAIGYKMTRVVKVIGKEDN